jgi:hypothetical protein
MMNSKDLHGGACYHVCFSVVSTATTGETSRTIGQQSALKYLKWLLYYRLGGKGSNYALRSKNNIL